MTEETHVTEENVDNQLGLAFEMLSDAITAFEDNDKEELLRGAGNLYGTATALLMMLNELGYNTTEAIARANTNTPPTFDGLDLSDLLPKEA
jgi:hypothetical protein